MSLIPYTVASCSSEDEQHPARELQSFHSQSRGWQSSRFCDFPQVLCRHAALAIPQPETAPLHGAGDRPQVWRPGQRAAGPAALAPVQDCDADRAFCRVACRRAGRAAGVGLRGDPVFAARALLARLQRALQVPGSRAQDCLRAAPRRRPLPPAAAAQVPRERAQPVQPARPAGGARDRRRGRRRRAAPRRAALPAGDAAALSAGRGGGAGRRRGGWRRDGSRPHPPASCAGRCAGGG